LEAEAAIALDNTILEPRTKSRSKAESQDSISAQLQQTKRSWDNPGVYAWGLNSARVVAPDSDERWIKTPRRLPFFDAVLLRDLKLDKNFGAAIDENGDLYQWGVGYAPDSRKPEITLKGQNLQSLAVSDDRIVSLSRSGRVFSVPVSREEQRSDPKLNQSSWLWSYSRSSVACRDLTPRDLGIGERITSIAGGLEHVVMLTSRGRVYTAASSARDYPKHGQLGIPGLNWYTRPAGPFDQPHEVAGLRGHTIKEIAAGDTHSLVLDDKGEVFAFGNNSQGQLGLQLKAEGMNLTNALQINAMVVDTPTNIPLTSLYPRSGSTKVVHVAAGGENSFFVVDRVDPAAKSEVLGGVSCDVWACGRGIAGSLGNGKLTHIQWGPTKVPFLSGLFEYNEAKGMRQSIPVKAFEVGQSHVAAIIGNITRVKSSNPGQSDTNWGSDVYFFGNNEHYQLGNGKRANVSIPTPIPALGSTPKSSQNDISMDRLQLTPGKSITFAGRSVKVEQRLECGRQCSAVFSTVV